MRDFHHFNPSFLFERKKCTFLWLKMRPCTNLRRIEKKNSLSLFFLSLFVKEGFFCSLFENSLSLPFCFFLQIRFLFQFKGKSEKMRDFYHFNPDFLFECIKCTFLQLKMRPCTNLRRIEKKNSLSLFFPSFFVKEGFFCSLFKNKSVSTILFFSIDQVFILF